ncbi:MAG: hypothetical protein EBS55_10755 [Flavobacteriaceae bacterium]|nr:hypothetical protein [Flavobacteriaceae bacterium]
MKTDWMIGEPIDFEYQEYKMLAYFQKVSQDLDNFKLYPHFRDISLNYASFSNLKSKDKYIKLINETEDLDDEILLSDLEFCEIPKLSPQDYSEYRTIVDFGEDKFKDYFLVAKSVWQIIYESLWVSLLENDDQLKRGRGFLFFDYGDTNYLYKYEQKPFKRNKKEKRVVLKPIQITKESLDIPKLISEDKHEIKKPGHPIFVIKIKKNTDAFVPLEETILPLIKRRINSFLQQSKTPKLKNVE